MRERPRLSCSLAPGLGSGICGVVFLFIPQESAKKPGLGPKKAGRGLGLAVFCLLNTWARHWLTSNPEKHI